MAMAVPTPVTETDGSWARAAKAAGHAPKPSPNLPPNQSQKDLEQIFV